MDEGRPLGQGCVISRGGADRESSALKNQRHPGPSGIAKETTGTPKTLQILLDDRPAGQRQSTKSETKKGARDSSPLSNLSLASGGPIKKPARKKTDRNQKEGTKLNRAAPKATSGESPKDKPSRLRNFHKQGGNPAGRYAG